MTNHLGRHFSVSGGWKTAARAALFTCAVAAPFAQAASAQPAAAPPAPAQPAAAPAAAPQPAAAPKPPMVTSPEVQGDRRIVFRLFAPQAQRVRLFRGDIPGKESHFAMTRGTEGVWETTVGPVPAGAFRYRFDVDGVTVMDPRNPKVSESNDDAWSVIPVPGSDFIDVKNVPHGAVAAVHYYSTALSRMRRMHIYTPPGYERGTQQYPVFYLLHGASDSDDSWTSVGRANFIIDNLIAEKKATPMIVVMPAGHTRPGGFRQPTVADEFTKDFVQDVMPYVEKHYRVRTDRASHAIAGLSMGGNQTLNVAIPQLDKFGYAGVFSSGLIGMFRAPRPGDTPPPPGTPTWAEENKQALADARTKGIKLLWFATGTDDFLLDVTRKTVEFFKAQGYSPVYRETDGGHTWLKWRDYLNEFTPQLFK